MEGLHEEDISIDVERMIEADCQESIFTNVDQAITSKKKNKVRFPPQPIMGVQMLKAEFDEYPEDELKMPELLQLLASIKEFLEEFHDDMGRFAG